MMRWSDKPCPECNARPHEMCLTKGGKRAIKPHSKRPVGDLKTRSNSITLQMETLR